MDKLTNRQAEVLQCIKNHIEATGYPPTRAEIAADLGFRSANAAEEHLKALARKGAIEMIPSASRGIRLPNANQGIPIVGKVAAGNPILAEENIDDYCNIPSSMFRPQADYLLRVEGQSMKNIGIMDGDLLAVHRTQDVTNGQIVVARIEDEVTVKRLKKTRKAHEIELLPENDAFEPIKVDLREQNCVIEGLSVGILRRDLN